MTYAKERITIVDGAGNTRTAVPGDVVFEHRMDTHERKPVGELTVTMTPAGMAEWVERFGHSDAVVCRIVPKIETVPGEIEGTGMSVEAIR